VLYVFERKSDVCRVCVLFVFKHEDKKTVIVIAAPITRPVDRRIRVRCTYYLHYKPLSQQNSRWTTKYTHNVKAQDDIVVFYNTRVYIIVEYNIK